MQGGGHPRGAPAGGTGEKDRELTPVPTLFRLLAVLVILAGIGFGAVYALATLVKPTPRDITVTIPAAKLQPSGR